LTIKDIENLFLEQQPFLKSFKEKYQMQINKRKLGNILGKVMASVVDRYWNEILTKDTKEIL